MMEKNKDIKIAQSSIGLEMGRGGSKFLNHEPPLVDPQPSYLRTAPPRGSMRFGSGSNLIDPRMHNFAKNFLFWTYNLMNHLHYLRLLNSVLVSNFLSILNNHQPF